MEAIYFEKQEGMMCAQHCLNALLQQPLFSAHDLATIAQGLDEEESRIRGTPIAPQDSENYDDSGYFSLQVLQEALKTFALNLTPWGADGAAEARADPASQPAFILNYHNHWFTVRKLGRQWFNLNSMLPGPDLLSDTYLEVFLTQLQTEKYNVFVVGGADLPRCDADAALLANPAEPKAGKKKAGHDWGLGQKLGSESVRDPELAAAIALSVDQGPASNLSDQERQDLEAALAMSLQDAGGASSSAAPAAAPGQDANAEAVRNARANFLAKFDQMSKDQN